ncbi:MAG: hypothetical protein OXR07_00365, partial [Nitrospira sp.]|nr:hypothetical protein [Nitrospira sp.]
ALGREGSSCLRKQESRQVFGVGGGLWGGTSCLRKQESKPALGLRQPPRPSFLRKACPWVSDSPPHPVSGTSFATD